MSQILFGERTMRSPWLSLFLTTSKRGTIAYIMLLSAKCRERAREDSVSCSQVRSLWLTLNDQHHCGFILFCQCGLWTEKYFSPACLYVQVTNSLWKQNKANDSKHLSNTHSRSGTVWVTELHTSPGKWGLASPFCRRGKQSLVDLKPSFKVTEQVRRVLGIPGSITPGGDEVFRLYHKVSFANRFNLTSIFDKFCTIPQHWLGWSFFIQT